MRSVRRDICGMERSASSIVPPQPIKVETSANHVLRTARSVRASSNLLNARMASSPSPSPADPSVRRAPSVWMMCASSVPSLVMSVLLLMFAIAV